MWVILAIFLLLFGHRIPGMARAMGSGVVEFKKGLKEGTSGASGDGPGDDGDKQPQDSGTSNG